MVLGQAMRGQKLNFVLITVLAVACKKPQAATQNNHTTTAQHNTTTLVDVVAVAEDQGVAEFTATDGAIAEPLTQDGRTGCVLLQAGRVMGLHANVTSLTFQTFANRHSRSYLDFILSWTVPPLYAHGGDDLAAGRVRYYEPPSTSRDRFNVYDFAFLDNEEQSTARGLTRSPVNILRVFAKRTGNALLYGDVPVTLATDQLARDDDGNELIEAGDFSVMSATVGDSSSDQTVARNIVAGAPVFARTVFAAAHPFVLGLRGSATENMVGNTVSFFTTRSNTAPTSHDNDFWPLNVDAGVVRRARNPVQALRDQLPDAFETTEIPGRGFAVVFRHDRKLWLGWLSQGLAPSGNLQEIPVLGHAPGRPRVTADGNQVFVVFADKGPTPDGGPAPHYRLRGASMAYGSHDPVTVRDLPIPIAGDMDDFAPFVAAMYDHTWVLSWTRGHADGAFSERGTVLLQSLDSALNLRGPAVVMSDADGGSDARLVTNLDGIALVAYAMGTGTPRKVAVSAARCAPLPAAPTADAGTAQPDA